MGLAGMKIAAIPSLPIGCPKIGLSRSSHTLLGQMKTRAIAHEEFWLWAVIFYCFDKYTAPPIVNRFDSLVLLHQY